MKAVGIFERYVARGRKDLGGYGLQFNVVLSVSLRTGYYAGSWAGRMHDRRSIQARQNGGGAANGDTLRIDMIQYPAVNRWCDAEQYLRLLLARSLSADKHDWTDPAGVEEAGAQPLTQTLVLRHHSGIVGYGNHEQLF